MSIADKKQTIKNKDTAIEAAQKTLAAHNQKIVEAANKKLSDFMAKWETETGCTLLAQGQFRGNQIETNLQVIIKPK